MLLNTLYTIQKCEQMDNTLLAHIKLNVEHEIFKGHFPDMPILPGVCQTQICIEVFNHLNTSLYVLQNASVIKFLSFINPTEISDLTVKLEWSEIENRIALNASINSEKNVFFKLRGDLKRSD